MLQNYSDLARKPRPWHSQLEAVEAVAVNRILALILRRSQAEPVDIAPSGQTFDFRYVAV